MKRATRLFKRHCESIEYFFGVICPLLSVLSLLDYAGAVQWAWLFLLWLSCGHFTLYFSNLYPPILKYRPFARGLFVFGVGTLWPVWHALESRRKRPVGLS